MEHFATLIQLICAINCAFIVVSFFERVYAMFFNEQQLNEKYLVPVRQAMDLYQGALEGLNPPDSNEWVVFKNKVLRLRQRIETYRLQLNAQQTAIHQDIESIRQKTGFKSFFLFISLYCFIDLFCISLAGSLSQALTEDNSSGLGNCPFILSVFVVLFNIFIAIGCVRFAIAIGNNSWSGKSDKQCYTQSVNFLLISLGIAWALACFLELAGMTTEMIPWGVKFVSNTLSVLLPFGPSIYTFYHFLSQQERIYTKVQLETAGMKSLLDDVFKEKESLEQTYYNMTQDDDIVWEGAA